MRRIARGRCGAGIGGFAMCSWAALEDDPSLGAGFAHVVAVDPPADGRRSPAANVCPHRPGPTWRGVSLSYALLTEYMSGTSPSATR